MKVTTFALLAFVIFAELRGNPTMHVMRRRLPESVQRQALAVALIAVGGVMASTLALLALSTFSFEQALFEALSAFATVGLSLGITCDLPPAAQPVVVVLMFVGRLGPVVLASALVMRERTRRFEYPEERPLVG
ncbi:potassium transporter TrkG [Saccharopolyspora elongata]|uniref:potassium transporter TrkG n=1 Tax=Saccharopolyspora elongata TaxID=2530387 RepID=UPI0022A765A2|nr:potassium transporter TrkG [Saccharopolyspora elongata]